jgi:hypothetical protein
MSGVASFRTIISGNWHQRQRASAATGTSGNVLLDGVRMQRFLDAWSIVLFFLKWYGLYERPDRAMSDLGISFRAYVLAERERERTNTYGRNRDYWMARLDSLPTPPDLRFRSDPSARKSPRFSRPRANGTEALEQAQTVDSDGTSILHGNAVPSHF